MLSNITVNLYMAIEQITSNEASQILFMPPNLGH